MKKLIFLDTRRKLVKLVKKQNSEKLKQLNQDLF